MYCYPSNLDHNVHSELVYLSIYHNSFIAYVVHVKTCLFVLLPKVDMQDKVDNFLKLSSPAKED